MFLRWSLGFLGLVFVFFSCFYAEKLHKRNIKIPIKPVLFLGSSAGFEEAGSWLHGEVKVFFSAQ